MKTIQLTHQGKHVNLTADEAVSLHNALTVAMKAAGIEAEQHATVSRPPGAQTFSEDADPKATTLTDC